MEPQSPIQASQFIDPLKKRAEELKTTSKDPTQSNNDLEKWLRTQADTRRRFPKSLMIPSSLYSRLAGFVKKFTSAQQLLNKTRREHEKLAQLSKNQFAQLSQTQEKLTLAVTALARKVVALEAQLSTITGNPLPVEPFHDLSIDILPGQDHTKSALNDLDNKLAKYLDFRNGFFIETGANDGVSQSNTHYLEKRLGWTGVLVEAIPELAAKCQSSRSNSITHQCALGADPALTPTVTMRYANLMSVVKDSMGSPEQTEAHVSAGVKIQSLADSYSVEVPVKTLTSILDAHPQPIPHINFFSLDVEGYELEVLKGLDLHKYTPDYILVETSKLAEVTALLSSHYDLADKLTVHDYLFRKHGLQAA